MKLNRLSEKGQERLEAFYQGIKESYFSQSYLSPKSEKNALDSKYYRKDHNTEYDFRQSVSRTGIDFWIFEESGDNSMVVSDYAKALARGEIKALRNKLSSTINEDEVDSYSELVDILNEKNLALSLIPLGLRSELEGRNNEIFDYGRGRGEMKMAGAPTVHSHKNLDIEKLYLIERSGVEISQKTSNQMKNISNINSAEYWQLSSKHSEIECMAKEKEFDQKVDFIMRTVIGLKVNSSKVSVIDVSNLDFKRYNKED